MNSWLKTLFEDFSPFCWFYYPECVLDLFFNLLAFIPFIFEIVFFPLCIVLGFIHDLFVFPLFRGGDI